MDIVKPIPLDAPAIITVFFHTVMQEKPPSTITSDPVTKEDALELQEHDGGEQFFGITKSFHRSMIHNFIDTISI